MDPLYLRWGVTRNSSLHFRHKYFAGVADSSLPFSFLTAWPGTLILFSTHYLHSSGHPWLTSKYNGDYMHTHCLFNGRGGHVDILHMRHVKSNLGHSYAFYVYHSLAFIHRYAGLELDRNKSGNERCWNAFIWIFLFQKSFKLTPIMPLESPIMIFQQFQAQKEFVTFWIGENCQRVKISESWNQIQSLARIKLG